MLFRVFALESVVFRHSPGCLTAMATACVRSAGCGVRCYVGRANRVGSSRCPLKGKGVTRGRHSGGKVRAIGDSTSSNSPPFTVPKDCFTDGTFPPELKAGRSMRLLFTMVALRVVLAHEEGFGNECHDDPSYTELYDDLTTFLSTTPLKDPEEWIRQLLHHEKLQVRLAAVRIIEVRDVYARKEFDWGETKQISLDEMEECRRKVMTEHLSRGM